MDQAIINRLNEINKEFYQTFAGSFSRTRSRVQPGVIRIMQKIPKHGNWLDLGCGNGNLALEWINQGRTGIYYGMDASSALVEHAQSRLSSISLDSGLNIGFHVADVLTENWSASLPQIGWDGVMMFAVLHHIPGFNQRFKVMKVLREMLGPGHPVYMSVWQLQNSPRLMSRVLPWSKVNIEQTCLEDGDVLMDWRAKDLGEPEGKGLRYVHIFNEKELADLASASGFQVEESTYSDGHEGNLGLYQCWRVIN